MHRAASPHEVVTRASADSSPLYGSVFFLSEPFSLKDPFEGTKSEGELSPGKAFSVKLTNLRTGKIT